MVLWVTVGQGRMLVDWFGKDPSRGSRQDKERPKEAIAKRKPPHVNVAVHA
jgi:hypothetical protein